MVEDTKYNSGMMMHEGAVVINCNVSASPHLPHLSYVPHVDPQDDAISCNMSALTMGTRRRVLARTPSGGSFQDEKPPASRAPTLYGRQQELDKLLAAYARISAPKAKSEVVILHGLAGSGKTRLAEALRGPVSQQGGYFVTGKFESSSKLPYPALVEALTDLCDLIAQHKGFGQNQQIKILQKIGLADTRRLELLLGNLHRVTGNNNVSSNNLEHQVDDPDDNDDEGASDDSASRQILLQWSLQKFLRACSSVKHPLCLFLDDLQLADQQSLQLLLGLVSDAIPRHVLFVLVYRSGTEDSLLQRELLGKMSRVQVSDILVLNLSIEAINRMIADSLQFDSASTLQLAEVVLRKTHGRPYCVLNYLYVLRRDGFVVKIENGWAWDMVRIQSETDVTDNVANIVTEKIQKCHKYCQLILKVASAIGYQFDRKLLEAVIIIECVAASSKTDNKTIPNFEKKINKYLSIALQEDLIEKTGYSGKLKFTHDKVKECVYSLIPEGEARQELHYRIGLCVQAMLPTYEKIGPPEWMVFAAAEQLNRAGPCKDPLELLRLNMAAAKLAQLRSFFFPAVDFLRCAQPLVDEHTLFTEHYELGRELYTLVAEREYAVGDFERSEAAATLVFLYAKCPDDKMGTFRVLVDAMDAQGRGNESVEIALGVLHEYGEDFPSKPKAVNVVKELVKTQHLLQTKTDEELINLPEINDEQKLHSLKLIYVFGSMTSLLGNELISLLSTLRVVQRSLRDGVAPISAHGFASFGMAMAMTGHPQEAYRFGNVALQMLNRFETPTNIQAHTLAVVHGGCRHWKEPFKDSLQPLMQAYEEGMAVGDVKFSLLAARNYLVGSLESGVSLSQVEVDMRAFCEGLDDMCISHNSAFRTIIVPVWQQVLNLMGNSAESPLVLSGYAMDEEKFILDPNATKFAGGMLAYTKAKLMLAYHFDNLLMAEQLVEELEKDERMVFWHFTVYQLKMICCLTYLHLSEQTGMRKHRVKALRILKKLEGWMEDGNVNCRPIVLLLRAEDAALTTTHEPGAVKQLFEAAILEARISGLTHIEALGNERAAMACVRYDEFREAAAYAVQARALYEHWGAHAKVDHLERKFQMIFSMATPSP